MRDNAWLENKLESIWNSHFGDVSRENVVEIKFGRCARTRLGSIRQVNGREFMVYGQNKKSQSTINYKPTTITITGFFKDERVPEYVINLTIAHELCHYAHGFFSPLPQLSKYPHQGGLVDSELIKRGFGDQLLAQKKWLKSEWPKIIGNNFRVKRRMVRRKKRPTGFELFKFLIYN